ncbi:unnamed protein product [Owenia fusiformis]|uniref:Uncharacterized protein n=1 Tax=Owenia fusiformis TaxID=6347 RepID=A0A8J1XWB7_OWEFU|nr:unnamed protein product [Owenia fusiformis]
MSIPGVLETLQSFTLDEGRLTFDVSKTKYGICGILCEKRWNKEKTESFWALLYCSPAQWRTIQDLAGNVDECLLNKDYSREFVITNGKLLGLSSSNDSQFVRFIVTTDDGELDARKSITITAEAWGVLKSHATAITDLLPQKRKYFSDEVARKQNQAARLSPRYRYICTRMDGQLLGVWHFLRSHAIRDMQTNNVKGPTTQIQKQCVQMPSNETILRRCFVRLLCDRINQLANDKPECEGCIIDHPSQVQHMGPGGCLEEVDFDHGTALEMLSNNDVFEVYKKLQNHLGLHEDINKSWVQININGFRKLDLSEEVEACLHYTPVGGNDDTRESVNNSLNAAIDYFQKKNVNL